MNPLIFRNLAAPIAMVLTYAFCTPFVSAEESFSPSSLSGLKLWLRSDRGVTAKKGEVTKWEDQSGNHFDAAPVSDQGVGPSLEDKDLLKDRKLPAIRFDGESSLLVGEKGIDLKLGEEYSIFIVLASKRPRNFGGIFSLLPATKVTTKAIQDNADGFLCALVGKPASEGGIEFYNMPEHAEGEEVGGGGYVYGNTDSLGSDFSGVVSFLRYNDHMVTYWDKDLVYEAKLKMDTEAKQASGYVLGAHLNPEITPRYGYFANMDLYEVIVIDHVLDDAEMVKMLAYLTGKP